MGLLAISLGLVRRGRVKLTKRDRTTLGERLLRFLPLLLVGEHTKLDRLDGCLCAIRDLKL